MAILNTFRPKDDFSLINYEELELKYEIYKYYPKFFHNEELSTPSIREMIVDKPIYAEANEHLKDWVNPGVMKIYETELDLDSGKLKIRKERKEQKKQQRQLEKEERRDKREERKEERRERREDHREQHQQRRGGEERKETSEESNRRGSKDSRRQRKKEKVELKRQFERRRRLIESKERKTINFNNPWNKQDSLMIYENQASTFDEESRKNSITSKLISLISNNSDDYKLLKTNSFDQTKSAQTAGRKRSLFKKRYSDQIGTYNNILNYYLSAKESLRLSHVY